jgi:hypothetical protein
MFGSYIEPGGRLRAHKHQTESSKEHQRRLFHGVESKMEFRNRVRATNLKEENKLIEAGFEYVRYSEKDQVTIYRKRK